MVAAPVVETSYGRVAGTVLESGVHRFAGIPFAAPPVGRRRWRPPEPPEPWAGTRDASDFGPPAVQVPGMLERLLGIRETDTSEDCLTLNVWTPSCSGRRPVMVWLHGGGFTSGAGSLPWYDGEALARRGDVVVVSVNYRLGALGFLHLGDLGGERFAGSGNAGLADQLAALRFVATNAAAFGGDGGRVTVFGESAGAMSIGALLGTAEGPTLFSRAILQSGAAANVTGRDEATRVAERFLELVGVGRDSLDTLVEIPADALLAAQRRLAAAGGWALPFAPVVDGLLLPEHPLDAVEQGRVAHLALLVGTNLEEMRLFGLGAGRASLGEEELEARAGTLFGTERASLAVATYRRNRPGATPKDCWDAMLGDKVFRLPAARLLEAHAGALGTGFAYLFTWRSNAFGGAPGACHAMEIPFALDNLGRAGAIAFVGDGPGRDELAATMASAWAGFASSGVPSASGLPDWPGYAPPARATMLLGGECRLEHDPLGDERALWEDVA